MLEVVLIYLIKQTDDKPKNIQYIRYIDTCKITAFSTKYVFSTIGHKELPYL